MDKAKRSIDHDLDTEVTFNTSMCLAYVIVGAKQKNRTTIHNNSFLLAGTIGHFRILFSLMHKCGKYS